MQETKITMLTYIEESPKQLEYNTLHSKEITKELVDLYSKNKCSTLWIVACGSSFNGAQCAKSFMMKYLDCHIKIIPPNTFIYEDHKLDKNDIVVVVSQSGCSTNSIEALKKIKELGHTAIGLTGNLDSDFKDYSDVLIDYSVGIETVGYVTKGVVTLAQFFMLFALEASLKSGKINDETYNNVMEELKDIPQRHKKVQELTWQFIDKNKKGLTSMSVVYSCGFMQGYGIACEAALKIGETIKVPSFAFEAEEYIHGPNLQLTPNYTVFFIDDMLNGSDRLVQIYNATKEVTDRAFIVTNNKTVNDNDAIRLPFEIKEPLLMPLYVLPVFQIISYKVTDLLNKWNKHPLYEEFKKIANSKTDNIHKVMKNFG